MLLTHVISVCLQCLTAVLPALPHPEWHVLSVSGASVTPHKVQRSKGDNQNKGKASIGMQDALGRSALMFAAGNSAEAALLALLTAGATLGLRDRRSRSVLDYAPEGSKVKQQLLDR